MLSRMKFEIDELVEAMLDRLPAAVWTSSTSTFFDPAIGGGQFVRSIERRLREHGHSNANIRSRVFGFETSNLHLQYAINKHSLVGSYVRKSYQEFFDLASTTKFDVVVGNPPYHDSAKGGGQNKIYNQFAKKVIDILNDNGKIVFLTPATVLKESKRFSLVGQEGLKFVDFTANNYFPDVGINVCAWILDKEYTGDVTVISNGQTDTVPFNTPIYDPSEFDSEFIKIYEALKNKTNTPDSRMFKQNPVDTVNGRSKTKTTVHQYPVYKIGSAGEELVQYNKPVPKLYGKKKFVISLTKSFTENSCTVSDKDFDVNHVFVDIKNQKEVANIKSFLFAEYFIQHSANFKKLDGYGFNNSLKYLPPFDKSKTWTNDEVKLFIESQIR